LQEKLKDATGRPAPISLLPSGGGQRKDSYPGPAVEAISPSTPGSQCPLLFSIKRDFFVTKANCYKGNVTQAKFNADLLTQQYCVKNQQ